ncbi:MAG: hypothetical protein JW955_23205 [Sedimentisphaerales bacterium]|nr:hypothetical protein [Sedimentisphaerales bacterium]
MRSQRRDILLGVLVLSLSMTLGCGKKSGQGTTPAPKTPSAQSPGAVPAPKAPSTQEKPAAPAPAPQTPAPQAAAPQPTSPPSLAQAAAVDTTKPLSEVQAQADTMSVDSLKATALKYKDAILGKQADLEKLGTKIKDIPITQALGQEATALKTDYQNLSTSLKDLKDRFQIYYDTLKKKGGDLSNLTF